jgi:acetyl esterase
VLTKTTAMPPPPPPPHFFVRGIFVVAFAIWFSKNYQYNISIVNNIAEMSFSVFEDVIIRPPWKCSKLSSDASTVCEREALGRMRAVLGATQYIPTPQSLKAFDTIVPRSDTSEVDVPVTLYQLASPRPPPKKRTLLLWFHYGGMVVGHRKDGLISQFADLLTAEDEFIVGSVGYRLAPEHKFPKGLNDCTAALKWFAKPKQMEEFRYGDIIVGGASAGGGLAVAIALIAKDQGIPLKGHVALVPMLLFGGNTKSYVQNANSLGLTAQAMMWYWTMYGTNRTLCYTNSLCSPLQYAISPDSKLEEGNLSPAIVVTARGDVLSDEGEEYVRHLKKYGNSAVHYPFGTSHLGAFMFPSSWKLVTDAIKNMKAREEVE